MSDFGLDWRETSDSWRAEVDEPSHSHRGATYQICRLPSPAVFELRWKWHPGLDWWGYSSKDLEELKTKDMHAEELIFRLEFDSLDAAMKDAQHLEELRRAQDVSVEPSGVLAGIRVQSCCGDELCYAVVDEREADLTGWKIETLEAFTGLRRIAEFRRDRGWTLTSSGNFHPEGWFSGETRYPWFARCNFEEIIRWIPPGEE